MEFRNLTPFSVMEYAMDDKLDERHRVVAMKTGFRLMQDAEGLWQTQLMENPPLPLCVEDEYSGEINRSPVLRESDLAPLKPACDIIVNGTAYTPGSIAVPEMTAGVLIRAPSGEVVLNKKLRITGQRFYRRQAVTGQWYETQPEPFTSLPLDYRYAFGGECRVSADSEYAKRIPDAFRLTEAQRGEHPDKDNPPLAHTVCPVNPLGLGYTQPWYLQTCKIQQVEAPVLSPWTARSPCSILQTSLMTTRTGLLRRFSQPVLAVSPGPGCHACYWLEPMTRNGWKHSILTCRMTLTSVTGTALRMTSKSCIPNQDRSLF